MLDIIESKFELEKQCGEQSKSIIELEKQIQQLTSELATFKRGIPCYQKVNSPSKQRVQTTPDNNVSTPQQKNQLNSHKLRQHSSSQRSHQQLFQQSQQQNQSHSLVQLQHSNPQSNSLQSQHISQHLQAQQQQNSMNYCRAQSTKGEEFKSYYSHSFNESGVEQKKSSEISAKTTPLTKDLLNYERNGIPQVSQPYIAPMITENIAALNVLAPNSTVNGDITSNVYPKSLSLPSKTLPTTVISNQQQVISKSPAPLPPPPMTFGSCGQQTMQFSRNSIPKYNSNQQVDQNDNVMGEQLQEKPTSQNCGYGQFFDGNFQDSNKFQNQIQEQLTRQNQQIQNKDKLLIQAEKDERRDLKNNNRSSQISDNPKQIFKFIDNQNEQLIVNALVGIEKENKTIQNKQTECLSERTKEIPKYKEFNSPHFTSTQNSNYQSQPSQNSQNNVAPPPYNAFINSQYQGQLQGEQTKLQSKQTQMNGIPENKSRSFACDAVQPSTSIKTINKREPQSTVIDLFSNSHITSQTLIHPKSQQNLKSSLFNSSNSINSSSKVLSSVKSKDRSLSKSGRYDNCKDEKWGDQNELLQREVQQLNGIILKKEGQDVPKKDQLNDVNEWQSKRDAHFEIDYSIKQDLKYASPRSSYDEQVRMMTLSDSDGKKNPLEIESEFDHDEDISAHDKFVNSPQIHKTSRTISQDPNLNFKKKNFESLDCEL